MGNHAYLKLMETGLLSVYRDRSMLITDLVIATGVPFFIQFAIWNFAYAEGNTGAVSDYSLEEMYLYYIAVLALNRLNNAYDLIVRVSMHVHEGRLEGILVKPISYFKYNFFIFLGGSILYYIPVLIIVAFVMVAGGSWTGALGFLFLSFASLFFCFVLGFLMSLSSFWLTRPDMTLNFQVVLASVIGGTLLPIAYWPNYLQAIMRYNPFRLIISGPAEFLLRPTTALLLELMCLYVVWFLVVWVFSKVVFAYATQRYSGVGG